MHKTINKITNLMDRDIRALLVVIFFLLLLLRIKSPIRWEIERKRETKTQKPL